MVEDVFLCSLIVAIILIMWIIWCHLAISPALTSTLFSRFNLIPLSFKILIESFIF